MGRGKAHYIEVTLDNEEEEDFGHLQNIEEDTTKTVEEEGLGHGMEIEEKAMFPCRDLDLLLQQFQWYLFLYFAGGQNLPPLHCLM